MTKKILPAGVMPRRRGILVLDPAWHIIERCGGPAAVAEMTGRHLSRVFRWSYPRERGGCDGQIPQSEAIKIINEASRRGIGSFTLEDFVALAGDLGRDRLRVFSLLMDGRTVEAIAKELGTSQKKVRETEAALRASDRINPDVWVFIERRQFVRREAGSVAA